MAWKPEDIERLEAAAASGVRRVTFADGRSTEYHDLAGIMATIDVVRAALATQGGGQRRRRATVLRVGRCR